MLYLFDLDGTLISSFMDNPDRAYDVWRVLPGRREKLAALRKAGHEIGLATNQAGVAFGHVTEAEVHARMASVIEVLGLPKSTPYEVCFGHPHSPKPQYRAAPQVDCRKPAGTMIRKLVSRCPAAAAQGVLYVGDRPDDEAAARDAGLAFAWAEAFFNDSHSPATVLHYYGRSLMALSMVAQADCRATTEGGRGEAGLTRTCDG